MNKNEDVVGAYVWIPGQGIDASASRRLRERYPRPTEPMGEAWFMGETRKMYPELLEREATQLGDLNVNYYLSEILSGKCNFGTLDFGPRREWESWFLYFLAQFTSPQHFGSDSILISGLMIFYPDVDKMREQEPQFLTDVLATAGRVLMEPQFWTNGEININHDIEQNYNPHSLFCEYHATNELFSASMFLCWKYLRAEQIETWFRSVLDIESVHWRAQLLIWLLGAQAFLSGEITQPEQLKEWRPKIGRMQPSILWEHSHLLNGFYEGHPRREEADEFLKAENIAALKHAIKKFITPENFFGWLDDFAKIETLQSELLEMPEQFFETFFK